MSVGQSNVEIWRSGPRLGLRLTDQINRGPDLEFISQLAQSAVSTEAGGVLVTNYPLRTSLIASPERLRYQIIQQIARDSSLICLLAQIFNVSVLR